MQYIYVTYMTIPIKAWPDSVLFKTWLTQIPSLYIQGSKHLLSRMQRLPSGWIDFTSVYRYSISVDNTIDNPIDNTIQYPDCIICSSFVTPHVLISHHTNFTELFLYSISTSIKVYMNNHQLSLLRVDKYSSTLLWGWISNCTIYPLCYEGEGSWTFYSL